MSALTKLNFGSTAVTRTAGARIARPRSTGRSSGLLAKLQLWSRRARDRRRLATMPNHLLRDMGITPDAAREEARKPFWRG